MENEAKKYTPSHVANFFLDSANREAMSISQLKLLKLVYIGFGWVLALTNRELFDEPILAWKHGPVVRSIYDEFKCFGGGPITAFAHDFDLENLELTEPRIPSDDSDAHLILNKVWKVYSPHSAWALRNMTHEAGTPWRQTYDPQERDKEIPDNLIRDHFREKIASYLAAK